MTDRERFEEWAQNRMSLELEQDDFSAYRWPQTADAWAAWQAAVAAERKRLVENIRKHADEYRLGISTPAYVAYMEALAWAIQQITEGK